MNKEREERKVNKEIKKARKGIKKWEAKKRKFLKGIEKDKK